MKNKKPAEMTNEELLKTKKTLATVTYLLGGMIVLMFFANTYTAYKKGFSALTVMPIAFLPIFIINMSSLDKIKKEIKERGL